MTARAWTSGPIFLVGMMGAGKSSVGPALARRLGRAFVDTDAQVEAEAGCSIAELFERDGEAAFRALEARAIEATAGQALVVALGGGAVAQPGGVERVARLGPFVYLQVGIETLLERIGDADARPLLRGLSAGERKRKLAALLAEREASYRRATLSVATDGLGVEEVAERVATALGAGRSAERPRG